MVGIGIIGAGTMGQAHADSLAQLPDAHIVAVMDTDAAAAQAVSEKHACNTVPSREPLLTDPAIQAVVIATPTPFHYAHVKTALEHGKHVFVEMPFVRHAEEGEELIALAKQNNLVLTVDHLLRYYREYKLIKQRYDEGAAGTPGMIRMSRQTPHPKKWYSNFESSGGVILDAMCHEMDYLQWCFGGIERIFCQSIKGRRSTDNIDYALTSIRLKNGAIAHIESSWSHRGQFNLAVEIAGKDGLIHYKNQEAIPMVVSIMSDDTDGRSFFTESPVIYPAQYLILKDFIHAVNGKGNNPVSGEDGLAAVKASLAAIKSAETRKPVTLEAQS